MIIACLWACVRIGWQTEGQAEEEVRPWWRSVCVPAQDAGITFLYITGTTNGNMWFCHEQNHIKLLSQSKFSWTSFKTYSKHLQPMHEPNYIICNVPWREGWNYTGCWPVKCLFHCCFINPDGFCMRVKWQKKKKRLGIFFTKHMRQTQLNLHLAQTKKKCYY